MGCASSREAVADATVRQPHPLQPPTRDPATSASSLTAPNNHTNNNHNNDNRSVLPEPIAPAERGRHLSRSAPIPAAVRQHDDGASDVQVNSHARAETGAFTSAIDPPLIGFVDQTPASLPEPDAVVGAVDAQFESRAATRSHSRAALSSRSSRRRSQLWSPESLQGRLAGGIPSARPSTLVGRDPARPGHPRRLSAARLGEVAASSRSNDNAPLPEARPAAGANIANPPDLSAWLDGVVADHSDGWLSEVGLMSE